MVKFFLEHVFMVCSNAVVSLSVSAAVRELRTALGLTQQALADRVGVSARAIANYEKNRTPTLKILYRLAGMATEAGRSDIAQVMNQALARQNAPVDITDPLHHAIIVALYENGGVSWLQKELADLIEVARKGRALSYPAVYSLEGIPDQEARISSLENLLVELRLRNPGAALELLEEMARARVEQSGETKEAAMTTLLIAHPDLYARYRQERASAVAGTQFESTLAMYGTKQHAADQKRIPARKQKKGPSK
jgi:transcriptional regulator with XRE-family HTH domain